MVRGFTHRYSSRVAHVMEDGRTLHKKRTNHEILAKVKYLWSGC